MLFSPRAVINTPCIPPNFCRCTKCKFESSIAIHEQLYLTYVDIHVDKILLFVLLNSFSVFGPLLIFHSCQHGYFCTPLCEFCTVELFQCRLRDITYSAPVIVDVEYMRQGKTVVNKVTIGRLLFRIILGFYLREFCLCVYDRF